MAVSHFAGANDSDKKKTSFSKIILSLENCILPQNKISPTPSELDGLSHDIEVELRILGCELIQTSGNLLRLPQVAMATGQVLFQRFYYSKSFVRHNMETVAMACVTLASKIEEAPRRIRDVMNVFHHIKQVKSGKTIQPLVLDQNYINAKNQVIKAERRVLKELGFCVHVKHPHKIIVTLLEVLKVKNPKLMQTAWNYMNDSLRSEVFVRYHPETIACACIYLSARLLQFPLPNKPAWFLIFGVSEADIHNICRIILSLYMHKKPDQEKLERIVSELQKTHHEAKLKAKGNIGSSAIFTNHTSLSPASHPDSPKSSKSPSELKKEREDMKNGSDSSPKLIRESNHRRKRSHTPVEDGLISPHEKKRNKTSSSSSSSQSPSPKHRKTPPRSFKNLHRSRSRSKTREVKKSSKHRSSHKRKRSHSVSPNMSPHKHSGKKAYKLKSSKAHHNRSPIRSHEHNHHVSLHEKSHKSRKDRDKSSRHAKDKNRR